MGAKGRTGTYFLQTAANQRPSRVAYDRDSSAIALAKPGAVDWDKALDNAGWFHVTGNTAVISASAAALSLAGRGLPGSKWQPVQQPTEVAMPPRTPAPATTLREWFLCLQP